MPAGTTIDLFGRASCTDFPGYHLGAPIGGADAGLVQADGGLATFFPTYRMHVKIGPDTAAGSYPLIIRAGIGDAEVFAVVNVVVDCVPPFILGTPGHQPGSTTVTSGQTAKLSVSPTGAAPFRYQWYT